MHVVVSGVHGGTTLQEHTGRGRGVVASATECDHSGGADVQHLTNYTDSFETPGYPASYLGCSHQSWLISSPDDDGVSHS